MSNVITSNGPRIMIGERTLATCHGADSLLAARRAKRWAKTLSVATDLLAVCRKAEPILDQYIDDQCERGDTPTDVAIVLVEMRHAIARAEAEPCQPD
jgi:hypothetical protein